MRKIKFKFLAMSMLLSGFSAGYIHAESHSRPRTYVSQQESQCKGVVLDETEKRNRCFCLGKRYV